MGSSISQPLFQPVVVDVTSPVINTQWTKGGNENVKGNSRSQRQQLPLSISESGTSRIARSKQLNFESPFHCNSEALVVSTPTTTSTIATARNSGSKMTVAVDVDVCDSGASGCVGAFALEQSLYEVSSEEDIDDLIVALAQRCGGHSLAAADTLSTTLTTTLSTDTDGTARPESLPQQHPKKKKEKVLYVDTNRCPFQSPRYISMKSPANFHQDSKDDEAMTVSMSMFSPVSAARQRQLEKEKKQCGGATFDINMVLITRKLFDYLQRGDVFHTRAAVTLLCSHHPTSIHSVRFTDDLTPLHIACMHGHVNVCKYLIDEVVCRWMMNAVDAYGRTPVEVARINGHESVVEYLDEVLARFQQQNQQPSSRDLDIDTLNNGEGSVATTIASSSPLPLPSTECIAAPSESGCSHDTSISVGTSATNAGDATTAIAAANDNEHVPLLLEPTLSASISKPTSTTTTKGASTTTALKCVVQNAAPEEAGVAFGNRTTPARKTNKNSKSFVSRIGKLLNSKAFN